VKPLVLPPHPLLKTWSYVALPGWKVFQEWGYAALFEQKMDTVLIFFGLPEQHF
jgi:hypothetical protein